MVQKLFDVDYVSGLEQLVERYQNMVGYAKQAIEERTFARSNTSNAGKRSPRELSRLAKNYSRENKVSLDVAYKAISEPGELDGELVEK